MLYIVTSLSILLTLYVPRGSYSHERNRAKYILF